MGSSTFGPDAPRLFREDVSAQRSSIGVTLQAGVRDYPHLRRVWNRRESGVVL